MKQQTLAMAADKGFEQFRRPTKRDVFLNTMDKIMPWPELCAVVQPHYPKGEGGRPPIGLERMVRMLCVQHWFNLADEACEEALYDSASLRRHRKKLPRRANRRPPVTPRRPMRQPVAAQQQVAARQPPLK